MKLQPRHFIAAPFLALSAFLLFSSLSALARSWDYGWGRFALTSIMTAIMVVSPGVLGVLALQRRWEDFVKIIGVFVAIAVFALLSQHTSALAKSADGLIGTDYPALGALWGACVTVSPFVICIVGYQRLVLLIVRRIHKDNPATL